MRIHELLIQKVRYGQDGWRNLGVVQLEILQQTLTSLMQVRVVTNFI